MRARSAWRACTCLAVALAPARQSAAALDVARLGAEARGLALGEACVAVADDATAAFWNPAGLGLVKTAGIAVAHRRLAPGLTLESGSAALRPWRYGTLVLGLGGQILSREGVAGRDAFSGSPGQPGTYQYRGAMHLALEPRAGLQVGASLGRVAGAVDGPWPEGAWSADAGLLLGGVGARFGAAVRGLGPSRRDADGTHPARYLLCAGLAGLLSPLRLLVACQVERERGGDAILALGGEWHSPAPLRLRLGARRNLEGIARQESYSAGLGVEHQGMRLDYAWRRERGQASEQALALHVLLGARADMEGEEEDASPPLDDAAERAPRLEPDPGAGSATALETTIPIVQETRIEPAPRFQSPAEIEVATPVAPPPQSRSPLRPEPEPTDERRQGLAVPALGAPAGTAAGRFVVRAGVHAEMDAAALEVARLYRAELRPTLEHRGGYYVVVVRRCATRAEAATWEARARASGVRCSIDEE